MTVSAPFLRYLGGNEGKVLRAYRDPVHIITIGYGFTWASVVFRTWWLAHRGHQLRMGDTMTEAEALEVLKLLVETEYMPPVERAFGAADRFVKEAGCDTTFNCGNGSLKWKWAQAFARGDVHGGAALLRTTALTAKGRKLPGLVKRRAASADLAEKHVYPAWVGVGSASSSVAPETNTYAEDVTQAQKWLEILGYSPGPADGSPGPRTTSAVTRFQKDHGQLTVDGKIGPATLSALQRAIDLRAKAGTVAKTTAPVAAGGVVVDSTGVTQDVTLPPDVPIDGLGWLGPLLFWGAVGVAVAALVYFAWRYRDEINTVLRKL